MKKTDARRWGASREPLGARHGLVGREREQGQLRERLAATRRGRGGLVLLRGELGIGKSRLAEVLAAQATQDGMLVLPGRAWESGAARAYWPWVQVMRAGASAGAGAIGGDAAASPIHGFLPEVAQRAGGSAPGDEAGDDFALFDGMAGVLRRASSVHPLVVILEDLHAADLASVRLLRFLIRELGDAAILFAATCRTSNPRRAPELADAVAGLAAVATNLPLAGLDEAEVAALAEAVIGRPVSSELVSELHRATGGNPLFVEEIAALLRAERHADATLHSLTRAGLPPRLREIARRRLESLSPACRDLLSVAATIGHEFSVALLERVCGLESHGVIELLHEAGDDGVVRAVVGAPGRRRFTHDLLRESLRADLGAARRIELHGRIGRVLETLEAADPTRHLRDLAHHFTQASPGGDRLRALAYHERAGHDAVGSARYEQGVAHFDLALRLLPPGAETAARRGALLLARSGARQRAGDALGAHEDAIAAAELARRTGDAELIARAALGVATETHAGRVDEERVGLLEQALEMLPREDGAMRSRVLARLSRELFWSDCANRRDSLAAEAVAMARRVGDPAALSYTLCCQRGLLWKSSDLAERLAISSEAVGLAERARDPEVEAEARQWRATDLLELGDRTALESELAAHARVVAVSAEPWHAGRDARTRAMLALLDGRFEEAERIARQAAERAGAPDFESAERAFHAQQFVALREQGRIEPLLAATRDHARSDAYFASHHPALRCGLALAFADLDDTVAVRRELRDVVEAGLVEKLHDEAYIPGLCALAEACACVGDTELSERLATLLLPYRGRNAVLGRALACLGPVSRLLGLLAATSGRWDDASDYFAEALDGATRLAAPPLRARVLLDWAAASMRRGGAAPEVRRMAEEALETARALGMELLAERARQLLGAEVDGVAADAAERAAPDTTSVRGSIRQDGELWVLEFGEEAARLEDSRGLRYLAQLLAEPGRERHALELAVRGESGGSGERPMRGDAGPLLDDAAKAAYRNRLRELRAEVDEAEANHDPGSAERASAEIEFLTAELARAIGLGGRDRRAASPAERARLNVTRALRRAIARVSSECPALGAHLQRCVRTGIFCVYQPDADSVRWAVEIR